MNINEAYPSQWLTVDDLKQREVTVVIDSCKLEEIGQGQNKERKLVISLVGKQKKFVCNKTNAKTIAGMYGEETEAWQGQRIILAPREVEFQGDMVWAIRVSLKKPAPLTAAHAPAAVVAKPASPPPAETLDEDVPF